MQICQYFPSSKIVLYGTIKHVNVSTLTTSVLLSVYDDLVTIYMFSQSHCYVCTNFELNDKHWIAVGVGLCTKQYKVHTTICIICMQGYAHVHT